MPPVRPSLCLQDDPEGIDVCLTCFNGGCLSAERHHAYTHYKKTGHAFALNVKRLPRPRPKRVRVPSSLPSLLSPCENWGYRQKKDRPMLTPNPRRKLRSLRSSRSARRTSTTTFFPCGTIAMVLRQLLSQSPQKESCAPMSAFARSSTAS